jgi:hypothetical protein
MTFSINNTMTGSTVDTITLTGSNPSPTYTISATNGTSGGLYWGLNGTSASPSQVVTTTGTGQLSWQDPSLQGASLSVKGDANFEGDIKVKGKSLVDAIEKIEERLAILHPNPDIEDKWDELKELGKRYRELEQEIIEKERVWAILKK